jgi:hypothetical protein
MRSILSVLMVALAVPAFAADEVCVGGSHVRPSDLDGRILKERGTSLWYLEQTVGEATHSYVELAVSQDDQLVRFAFSEPIAGRASLQAHIEKGGLFQLFRKFIHVATRQPDGRAADDHRIGRLGKRLLENHRVGELRIDLWEIKLDEDEAAYRVSYDLSTACLRY